MDAASARSSSWSRSRKLAHALDTIAWVSVDFRLRSPGSKLRRPTSRLTLRDSLNARPLRYETGFPPSNHTLERWSPRYRVRPTDEHAWPRRLDRPLIGSRLPSSSKSISERAMPDSVMAWLRDFATCVRARDFDRGRSLCSEDIVSFGTVVHIAVGLEQLINQQWSRVWHVTCDFEFDYEHMRIDARDDLAWVAAPWASRGFAEDGSSYLREGRATIVLRREQDGWRGIHTHFSTRPRGLN